MVNFSASILVKRSASQIAYMMMSKKVQEKTLKVNENIIKGDNYAKKMSSRKKDLREIGGFLQEDGFRIYFSVDLIRGDKAIEIKMVNGKSEEWYLNSSLIQACLFKELIKNSKELRTAKFAVKQGERPVVLTNIPDKFRLWFGNQNFQINRNERILIFYVSKCKKILETLKSKDFSHVKEWDEKFKHKEFGVLKPKFRKLKELNMIPEL